MPDETGNRNDSNNEPEPVAPDRRRVLVRLWDSGIPLWQKLVVWAGALGVIWTTLAGFLGFFEIALFSTFPGPLIPHDGESVAPVEPTSPVPEAPIYSWLAIGLTLSVGLWLWPLMRGRGRTLALVLAAPATLGFLILFPFVGYFWLLSVIYAGEHPDFGMRIWFNAIMPPFVYLALAVVWTRAIRDYRARRAQSAD